MVNKNMEIGFAIIIVIIGITTVILLMKKKDKKDKESYKKCICSSRGGTERNCQDTEVVNDLYNSNKLTEYSDFKPKGWTTISPGDYDYPHSEGCNWNDGPDNSEWRFWDFTDF
jgi:hypothetical protein